MPKPNTTDEALAAIIHNYWRERGCGVHVWVSTIDGHGRGVRSELVCGLPAGYQPVNGQHNLAIATTRASAATQAEDGDAGAHPPEPHRAPAVAFTVHVRGEC